MPVQVLAPHTVSTIANKENDLSKRFKKPRATPPKETAAKIWDQALGQHLPELFDAFVSYEPLVKISQRFSTGKEPAVVTAYIEITPAAAELGKEYKSQELQLQTRVPNKGFK